MRCATPEDVPALARVHVDAWLVAYDGLLAHEILDALSVQEREAQWRERLAPGGADAARVTVR